MGRVSSYTFSYRTKIVLQHQRSSVEDEANVKRIRKYNRKSQKASFIAIRVLCQSGMEPNKELCERRRRRPPRSSSESHLYALKSNLGCLCSRRKRIDHRWMSFCFTLFFPFSVLYLSLSFQRDKWKDGDCDVKTWCGEQDEGDIKANITLSCDPVANGKHASPLDVSSRCIFSRSVPFTLRSSPPGKEVRPRNRETERGKKFVLSAASFGVLFLARSLVPPRFSVKWMGFWWALFRIPF